MKKRQLEMVLSQLKNRPKPKLKFEGYTLDPLSAANLVQIAAQINDDIEEKKVVDLGCGSGILAIAAALLEAQWVVGIDIDKKAVEVADENARRTGVTVDFIVGEISCVMKGFDTTLMNPPFGCWRRGADLYFLKKALEISKIVYSIHKHSSSVRDFLRTKIPEMSANIDKIYESEIVIYQTYSFHKKKKYPIKVDIFRTTKI